MLQVAIESSSRHPSVALRLDQGPVKSQPTRGEAHAKDLLPALRDLLHEHGAEARDIDEIYVGSGPGSYTGLRVGMATALGLARATGARLRAIPSGEVLAWGRLAQGEVGILLLDARGEQIYFARYARRRAGVEVLHAPCVLSPDEARDRLLLPATSPGTSGSGANEPGPQPLIFGDKTVAAAAQLPEAARARLDAAAIAEASDLLELGTLEMAEYGPTPLDEVEPLYLRPFQAKPRKR